MRTKGHKNTAEGGRRSFWSNRRLCWELTLELALERWSRVCPGRGNSLSGDTRWKWCVLEEETAPRKRTGVDWVSAEPAGELRWGRWGGGVGREGLCPPCQGLGVWSWRHSWPKKATTDCSPDPEILNFDIKNCKILSKTQFSCLLCSDIYISCSSSHVSETPPPQPALSSVQLLLAVTWQLFFQTGKCKFWVSSICFHLFPVAIKRFAWWKVGRQIVFSLETSSLCLPFRNDSKFMLCEKSYKLLPGLELVYPSMSDLAWV